MPAFLIPGICAPGCAMQRRVYALGAWFTCPPGVIIATRDITGQFDLQAMKTASGIANLSQAGTFSAPANRSGCGEHDQRGAGCRVHGLASGQGGRSRPPVAAPGVNERSGGCRKVLAFTPHWGCGRHAQPPNRRWRDAPERSSRSSSHRSKHDFKGRTTERASPLRQALDEADQVGVADALGGFDLGHLTREGAPAHAFGLADAGANAAVRS